MHNEESLFNILTNYLLNIDYDTLLAFDTSEIVIGSMPTPTIAVLGQENHGKTALTSAILKSMEDLKVEKL
jgi:hypothetical protein